MYKTGVFFILIFTIFTAVSAAEKVYIYAKACGCRVLHDGILYDVKAMGGYGEAPISASYHAETRADYNLRENCLRSVEGAYPGESARLELATKINQVVVSDCQKVYDRVEERKEYEIKATAKTMCDCSVEHDSILHNVEYSGGYGESDENNFINAALRALYNVKVNCLRSVPGAHPGEIQRDALARKINSVVLDNCSPIEFDLVKVEKED